MAKQDPTPQEDRQPVNRREFLNFAWLASLLFLKHITDLHSGMRAYRKQVLEKISYDPDGPALPVELLLKHIRLNCRMKVVYIDYLQRIGNSTLNPIESAWWTLKRILRTRFCNGEDKL